LSLEISIILLLTYGLSLVFSLHTHKQLFTKEASESAAITDEDEDHQPGHQPWSLKKSLLVLLGATALVAWVSEFLVGSVEKAAESFGMNHVFVGVIVVAIIGNAAEHSTAILVAMKNRMDLAIGVAIGSSIQIALFVAPVLVIASYFMGKGPMDLVFSPAEVLAVGLTVIIYYSRAGLLFPTGTFEK
jgi:Ca2+:H+ antiporter